MKKIIIVLLASLLVFGCLGPSPADSANQEMQQQAASDSSTAGNGSEAPDSTTQDTEQETQDIFDAATVATYSAAMAAGVPLECTVLVEGVAQKIYIRGENMMMSTTTQGTTYNVVAKDDNIYMELDAQTKDSYSQMGMTCDWLVMEGGDDQSGGMQSSSGSESVDVSSYTDSNVQWTCSAAMFGDEKFATPGATCTFEEIMQGMGLPVE
jgi:hypothetical protein